MVDVYTAPFLNQLRHYLASGFDIQQGAFVASEDIFNLSFELQNSVPWPVESTEQSFEKLMLVPDQFACDTAPDTLTVEETSFMRTKEDFSRSFGLDIKVEGKTKFFGMKFAVAAQSSMMFTGSLFKDQESTYALNFYIASILRMNRQILRAGDLTEAFKKDVDNLPSSAEALIDQQKYLSFLEKYGTHYLDSASFGGVIYMQTSITKNLFEKGNSKTISGGLSASFKAGISSGSASLSASVSTTDFFSQNSESVSSSISVKGGLFVADGSVGDWYHSLYDAPMVLLTVPGSSEARSTFVPISKLMDIIAPQKKSAMLKMIDAYGALAEDDSTNSDSLFLAPKTVNENIVYEIKDFGAGLLIVTATGPHEVSVLANYTTLLETTYRPSSTNGVAEASVLTAPILQTGNFLIQRTVGEAATNSKFFELNPNLATFGHLSQLLPMATGPGGFISPEDALLIVELSAASVSTFFMSDLGSTFAGIDTLALGKPVGAFYNKNSMIIPLRKNVFYSTTLSGTAKFRLLSFSSATMYFETPLVALDNFIGEGYTQVFATNVTYQVPTDGFLIVFFNSITGTSNDGGLSVYSSSVRDNVLNNDPSAFLGTITRNGATTNMFPISNDAFFKVSFNPTGGGSVILTFIPIVVMAPTRVHSDVEYDTNSVGQGFLIKSLGITEVNMDARLSVNGTVLAEIFGEWGSFTYPIGARTKFTLLAEDSNSFQPSTEGKLKAFATEVLTIGVPVGALEIVGIGSNRTIFPDSDGMLIISLTASTEVNVTVFRETIQIAGMSTGADVTKKMISVPVQKGVGYVISVGGSGALGAKYHVVPWTSQGDRFVLSAPASMNNAGMFQSDVNGFLTVTGRAIRDVTTVFAICHADEQYVLRRFAEAFQGGSMFSTKASAQGTTNTVTIPVLEGEFCQVVKNPITSDIILDIQFHVLFDTLTAGSASVVTGSDGGGDGNDLNPADNKKIAIIAAVVTSGGMVLLALLLVMARRRYLKKKSHFPGVPAREGHAVVDVAMAAQNTRRQVPNVISSEPDSV